MCLKTPRFWYSHEKSWLSTLLLPFSFLYAAGHALHQGRAKPYTSSLPVLCLGNLVAGGSGKTPAALALHDLILKYGLASAPHFLSRGYGGSLKGPLIVDPAHHTAAGAGDEPLLLARKGPAIIAADRAEGAKLAERSGADLIVMDDGLHNTALAKTLKIVVIDGATGFGNERLLPAGPLRTSLSSGLARADAFILIGEDETGVLPKLAGKPVLRASLETEWRPQPATRYIAFCGLGHPGKFFKTLDKLGAQTVCLQTYPDHHAYDAKGLETLAQLAAHYKARLVTTEKDAQRLPESFLKNSNVDIVPVALRWADEDTLGSFLKQKINIGA